MDPPTAPRGDVVHPGDEAAGDCLDVLAHHRLVTVTASSVELAHEALLTGWPRLAGWLDERAVVADQLEHLGSAATAWEQDGRPGADLLRGPRLQAAVEWSAQHPDDLTREEQEYVEASQEALDDDLRVETERANHEAAQRPGLRRLLAGTAALLVITLVAGSIAAVQRNNATTHGASLSHASWPRYRKPIRPSTARCCSRWPLAGSTTPSRRAPRCWAHSYAVLPPCA